MFVNSQMNYLKEIYLCRIIVFYLTIGPAGRMFVNGPGDWGSIPS